MGCIESSTLQGAEVEFTRAKIGRNTLFAVNEDNPQNEEDIKIDENVLCDENTLETLTFSTKKNDIRPMTRSQIGDQSDQISRMAIQKLIGRRDEDADVKNIAFDKDRFSRRLSKQIKP